MLHKDDMGRTCGFFFMEEEAKKKKFEKRFCIINNAELNLELYSSDPSVSLIEIIIVQNIIFPLLNMLLSSYNVIFLVKDSQHSASFFNS